MSWPSKITFPLSARSKPPMIRRVVVLPQPLGPSRVTKVFSFTERFKSSNTRVPSKLLDTLTKSMRLLIWFPPGFLKVSMKLKTGRGADPENNSS